MARTTDKYPRNVLDSVLGDSGHMPAARIGIRSLAFIIDWALIGFIASLLILRLFMPPEHLAAVEELNPWINEVIGWINSGGFSNGTPAPQQSAELQQALAYAQLMTTFLYWLYFAVGEAFFAGSSLGKSFCRLRTISTVTMEKPPLLTAFGRAAIKALALLFPLVLFVTLLFLAFNRRRQMGHDLACHTAVIDERYCAS